MKVDVFCGGIAQTNGYVITDEKSTLVVDAPDGMADWLKEKGIRPVGLLVTHGHWDHIVDAWAIQQNFKIPVVVHQDSAPLLEKPSIQLAFNPFYRLQPCQPDDVLTHERNFQISTFNFQLLLCPGHCPGSLCFYLPEEKMLFGGDVLFSGGVGRWDLPGASQKELFESIATKILTLPDETQVFPGHGSSTTIGEERRTNPFLLEYCK